VTYTTVAGANEVTFVAVNKAGIAVAPSIAVTACTNWDSAGCAAELIAGYGSRVLACQQDQRDRSGGPGLELTEGRRFLDQTCPQLGPAAVIQLLGHHRERLAAHLDGDPGVRSQVVIPAGWVGDPPLEAMITYRPSPWRL
jgi:hypothetical protein